MKQLTISVRFIGLILRLHEYQKTAYLAATNYYMDLDYKAYIPEEYLLDGFDATSDNPYRKKMLKEN